MFKYTGKTYTAEEQRDRAAKAIKLNGIDSSPTLYPISQPIGNKDKDRTKPTVRIRRLKRDLPIKRLKGASALQINSSGKGREQKRR